MNKEPISLGVDLSLTNTGLVVLNSTGIIKQKLIKSKPLGEKPTDELIRIKKIIEDIEEFVSEYYPSVVCIEGLAFMAKNTTALVQLSALNYMTRSMLNEYNIPFVIVAPTTLKKFVTGKGNSDKEVLMMMVYRDYNEQLLDNNIVDAFALSLIGMSLLGKPIKKLTVHQQEVIKLVSKQV